MNINDRVYILTTDSDDYFSVTVIPATIRRIIVTTEADEDGVTTESTAYMVAFDGEPPTRSYHTVNEADVVDPRYTYNHSQKIGDAILAKIEAMKPTPPVEVGPPPTMEPAPVLPADTPF